MNTSNYYQFGDTLTRQVPDRFMASIVLKMEKEKASKGQKYHYTQTYSKPINKERYNLTLLYMFICKILNYEPGLKEQIKSFMKSYIFKTKEELQNAIKGSLCGNSISIEKYGNIFLWDVSNITDQYEDISNHIWGIFLRICQWTKH